jgi:hypothetical protein
MVFWRAVLPHCRKIFGASGYAPSSFAKLLEGRAPARPKNFSTAVTVPCDFSPNEFGAQEKSVINHWLKPVAWAEKS